MSFVKRMLGMFASLPAVQSPARGTVSALGPATDAREPEEMPTDWALESYDAVHGHGVLVRQRERVSFDVVNWHAQQKSPGLSVRVSWKRSRVGAWNVVDRVDSTRSPEPDNEPRFTMGAWLQEFSKTSGRLRGLSEKKVLLAAQSDAHLGLWSLGESVRASEFMEVLSGGIRDFV